MQSDLFKNRLIQEWLVPFCQARNLSTDGFSMSSLDRLFPADARDFMYAIDSGLVQHNSGTFTAPLSKAKEQIFWEGPKDTTPRKLTLWIEPIITIAGLARLHRDFGWNKNDLGLQSATWEFDLVAYQAKTSHEALVCEVKKSIREVEKLIEWMHKHANSGERIQQELKGAELNACRKASALRRSKCSTFWALGPNNYHRIFKIHREVHSLILLPADESSLHFSHN